MCKLTELTKYYRTWEIQAIPALPKGWSTNKVFLWLKEEVKCTSRENPWVLLNREGRVKDITIGGNFSSAKIKELVKENFSGLAAAYLNR